MGITSILILFGNAKRDHLGLILGQCVVVEHGEEVDRGEEMFPYQRIWILVLLYGLRHLILVESAKRVRILFGSDSFVGLFDMCH